MSKHLDLQELERQAYRTNFQDGLWDILLGLLLLQTAFGPVLYKLGWSPLWILTVMLGFAVLILIGFKTVKKNIVTPRLGLVNFGPVRQAQKKKQSLMLSLAVLLGVVVLAVTLITYQFAVNAPTTAVFTYALMIFSGLSLIVAVVVFSVAGYTNNFPRAYLYGWFYGLAFPLNILLDDQFGITFPLATILFSAVMIMVGLILFARFLRNYPLAAKGN